MWIPADPNRFTSRFKYVELARYVPKLNSVIRLKNGEDPALFDLDEAFHKAQTEWDNTGVYTSVFQYENKNLLKSQAIGNLYFDLDSPDIEKTHEEAKIIYNHLSTVVPEKSLHMYFSGQKGFHIECEAVALGIGPSGDLPDIFRFIANDLKDSYSLETLDFQVYDLRRMWRMAGSIHQKTGKYKNKLPPDYIFGHTQSILDYCSELQDNTIQPQEWSSEANEWFREFTYKKEEEKLSKEDVVQRFMKHGTGIIRDVDGEREFDPVRLFDKCPAIMKLWNKAEKNHHLDHEERLFLCSILTYTEESIWYLHEILRNCSDYNPSKSQAHIDDWVKRRDYAIGGRPYSCDRANSAGIGCGDCDLKAKERYQVIGNRMVPTGEMASPSPIRYAYRWKKKND